MEIIEEKIRKKIEKVLTNYGIFLRNFTKPQKKLETVLR